MDLIGADAVAGWLTGKRVVVTRPVAQATELCRQLAALGAVPVEFPVISIAPPEPGGPLDAAIARLEEYDWVIFTSVNGVRHFWTRLTCAVEQGLPAPGVPGRGARTPLARLLPLRVAAIGPATAEALARLGVHIDLVPAEYRSDALLAAMDDVTGWRILLPRADIAPPALADGLAHRGALVEEVTAYRTIPAMPPAPAFDALRGGVDVVTLTSASSARSFVALTAGLDLGDPLIACIGPVTAAAARELGLRVDLIAEEYTIEGLVEALARYRDSGSLSRKEPTT